MKMFLRRAQVIALALSIAALALTPGCLAVAAAGAAAGTVAWVKGELDASVAGKFDAVERAANRAVEQLQFAKVNEKKSAIDAEIVSRTGQDKRIVILLNRTTDTTTRVRIRVGAFGDEALSRMILEKIQAGL